MDICYTSGQLIVMLVVGFLLGFTLTMLIVRRKVTIVLGEEDK